MVCQLLESPYTKAPHLLLYCADLRERIKCWWKTDYMGCGSAGGAAAPPSKDKRTCHFGIEGTGGI